VRSSVTVLDHQNPALLRARVQYEEIRSGLHTELQDSAITGAWLNSTVRSLLTDA
jgi:hypothetical protein